MAIGGESLGDAVLELRTDDSKYTRGIRSARGEAEVLDKRFDSISSSLRNIGSGIVAAFGVHEIGQFVKDAVSAASDVQEMQSLLSVTFGKAADDVREWAAATAEAVGRSRFELLQFAGDFASFMKPLGTAPDQIRPMAQALAQLTVDLSSFRNLAESDVMAKLISGLAGETEAVRRLGVDLSAAAVEQELLALGINKTNAEASQAEKVMARYNIIMRQTVDAQGDAARTADGLANMQRRLQGQLQDLRVEIGNQLMPVMRDLVGALAAIVAILPQGAGQVSVFTQAWVVAHQVVGGAALLIIRGVQGIAEASARLLKIQSLVVPGLRDSAAEARKSADAIGVFADSFRDASRQRIDKFLDDAAKSTGGLSDATIDLNVNIEGLGDTTAGASDKIENVAEKGEEATNIFRDMGAEVGAMQEAIASGAATLDGEFVAAMRHALDLAAQLEQQIRDDIAAFEGLDGDFKIEFEIEVPEVDFDIVPPEWIDQPSRAFEERLTSSAQFVGEALAFAVADALSGGDVDAAIAQLGHALGDAAGQAVGAAVAASIGGAAGGVAGGFVGAATAFGIDFLIAGLTDTGPFTDFETTINGVQLEISDLGIELKRLQENMELTSSSASELNAAEAQLLETVQGVVSTLLTQLGVVLPEGLESFSFAITEFVNKGVSQFDVLLNLRDIQSEQSVGFAGEPETELRETFDTLEEAIGFATQEFLRHIIEQGIQIDEAVRQIVEGDDVPLSVFAEAVQRVQGLADQASMSLDGLSALEIEMGKLPAATQQLAGELRALGLSADQVTRLVGGQLVQSFQAWRQQITGEELSVEQRKAIAEAQRQLFNAEMELQIARLEADQQALLAEAGLTQAQIDLILAKLNAEQAALGAEGQIAKASVGLQGNVIHAETAFLKARGQIATGELAVMKGFTVGAGAILQSGVRLIGDTAIALGSALGMIPEEIRKQVLAIQKVIDALRKIGFIKPGDINIPGIPNIPSPGGPGPGGGSGGTDPEDAIRGLIDALLQSVASQQDLVDTLTDELGGLSNFLRDLRVTGGPSPLTPARQVDALRDQLQDAAKAAETGDIEAIREFQRIAGILQQVGAEAFGTAGAGFEALLDEIEFLGGDVLADANEILEDELDVLEDVRNETADLLEAAHGLHDLTQEQIDAIRNGTDAQTGADLNIIEQLEDARRESREDLRALRDALDKLGRILADMAA